MVAPLAHTEVARAPSARPAHGLRASSARVRRYLGWLKIVPVALVLALLARHRVIAPLPVYRVVVDQGDVVREVFGRATIESRRDVQLGFDLVRRVSDVLVDEGDRVTLGQVLAHLAPGKLSADVHAAWSGISLAKAATARRKRLRRRPTA